MDRTSNVLLSVRSYSFECKTISNSMEIVQCVLFGDK